MSGTWWGLPGPAEFVASAVDELRRGRSLQLCLPLLGCGGLRTEIGRSIAGIDGLLWEPIDLADEEGRPLELLYRRLAPGARPGTVRSAATLLDESQCRGAVVWVDGIRREQWPAWRAFLAEFESASRGRELTDRMMLVLALHGFSESEAAPSDVCLAVREWQGVVTAVDSWIYAARANRERGRSPTQRWLRVATVAHLAMWDPALADWLSDLSSAALLQPLDVLRHYANAQGWQAQESEPSWRLGSVGMWDGKTQLHTAWHAAKEDHQTVLRRVWKAQAQALMPFLEEKRSELLTELDTPIRARLPFTPKGADVAILDPRDLELGHIQTLIYGSGVDRGTWRRVDVLRRMRNCLTHFEVIPSEVLFAPTMAADFGPE